MVFVAVAAVAGITALALARLIGHADASLSAAARLYEVAARLNAVEANEWELIAERRTPSPVEQELAGNLAAATTLIDDLSARLPDFVPVAKRFNDYRRALDEEVRLLLSGSYDAARQKEIGRASCRERV